MATIVGTIMTVKLDKRDKPMARISDADTKQIFTVYMKNGLPVQFTEKMMGKKAVVNGTIHAIPNPDPEKIGLKIIATSVALAK